MAATLLETTRASHERIERLERATADILREAPKTHKEKIVQQHRVSRLLDTLVEEGRKLGRIYADADGSRKEEIQELGSGNVFAGFYDRLKSFGACTRKTCAHAATRLCHLVQEVREYHRKYPDAPIDNEASEIQEVVSEEPWIDFTGEEGFGKYLDLHELYSIFVNAKFGKKCEYAEFLTELGRFELIPKQAKFCKEYKEFLERLLTYLTEFHRKVEPLQSLEQVLRTAVSGFESKWDSGQLPGWNEAVHPVLDVAEFDSVDEIEALGPEKLKEALSALGLKTGGTIRERAARLFLTKGVELSSLPRKHFAKGSKALVEEGEKKVEARQIALLEVKIESILELLPGILNETIANIERKASRTVDEMEEELEAELEDVEDESDDDGDEAIYNPLKLPMGWDGKPIPYWLYKLHGLNLEQKCEVCGDFSYWGPRAFERHFFEARHQDGLRRLGVASRFHRQMLGVTKIDEALSLFKELQNREKHGMPSISSAIILAWKLVEASVLARQVG
eukprot:scaffold176_cov356-Prasinococcus_capsulatus_cf.AAC.9